MHMSASIQGPEVSDAPRVGVMGNHELPSVTHVTRAVNTLD